MCPPWWICEVVLIFLGTDERAASKWGIGCDCGLHPYWGMDFLHWPIFLYNNSYSWGRPPSLPATTTSKPPYLMLSLFLTLDNVSLFSSFMGPGSVHGEEKVFTRVLGFLLWKRRISQYSTTVNGRKTTSSCNHLWLAILWNTALIFDIWDQGQEIFFLKNKILDLCVCGGNCFMMLS